MENDIKNILDKVGNDTIVELLMTHWFDDQEKTDFINYLINYLKENDLYE